MLKPRSSFFFPFLFQSSPCLFFFVMVSFYLRFFMYSQFDCKKFKQKLLSWLSCPELISSTHQFPLMVAWSKDVRKAMHICFCSCFYSFYAHEYYCAHYNLNHSLVFTNLPGCCLPSSSFFIYRWAFVFTLFSCLIEYLSICLVAYTADLNSYSKRLPSTKQKQSQDFPQCFPLWLSTKEGFSLHARWINI